MIVNIGLSLLNGVYAYEMYKQEEHKIEMLN